MKIVVAAFYADVINSPSRFDEFLPFIKASRFALSVTNPHAEYVVLTDYTNSKLLREYQVECVEIAPEHMPLMAKIIFAQREFVARCNADLIVLPDVDCIVNRALEDSIPEHVGLAITHRGRKFEYSVNNLAYIRNRELAYWFLDRAYRILDTWPLEKRLWGGDQEAWQAALDPALDSGLPYSFEELGDDILVSRPFDQEIYLYPCNTHNCFMNDAGIIKDNHRNAFAVHLKGPRKQHLSKWMRERFDYDLASYRALK